MQDLISVVFEQGLGPSLEDSEIEALQSFASLVDKINEAVEQGKSFNIEFTFMNQEGSGGMGEKRDQRLKPLAGEKFEKSRLV